MSASWKPCARTEACHGTPVAATAERRERQAAQTRRPVRCDEHHRGDREERDVEHDALLLDRERSGREERAEHEEVAAPVPRPEADCERRRDPGHASGTSA